MKNILINALNRVVIKHGYSYAEDSTRVITIKKINHFDSCIEHSCDFAIVNNYAKNGYSRQEYIHFNKKANQYYWCELLKDIINYKKKFNG